MVWKILGVLALAVLLASVLIADTHPTRTTRLVTPASEPIAQVLTSTEVQQRDLAAQERMAAAAEGMTVASWAQLGVGILTVIGLLVTFEISRRTLKQAREQLSLSRDTSHAQLRPYLGFDGFDHERVGDHIHVRFKFRNFGQTTASHVKRSTRLRLLPTIPDDLEIQDDELVPWQNCGDIAPDSYFKVGFSWNLAELGTDERFREILENLENGGNCAAFAVVIEYRDSFGKPHEFRHSSFRYGRALADNHFNVPFMRRDLEC